MRVIAVIMVRNGVEYAEKCISHLIENGIEVAIIDQSSDDGTYEVCQSFINDGVCKLQRISYPGYFSLKDQLLEKNKLMSQLQTDWLIHYDIDECLESPDPNLSLYESIKLEDSRGYNAINFNEFVFLPYDESISFYDSSSYYFFEPFFPRLMRAWKKNSKLSGLESGGHLLKGSIKLSPENHILKHYVFTSQQHALNKYKKRLFSKEEITKGWHRNRLKIESDKLIFPDRENLEVLMPSKPYHFVTSNPWEKHYWE